MIRHYHICTYKYQTIPIIIKKNTSDSGSDGSHEKRKLFSGVGAKGSKALRERWRPYLCTSPTIHTPRPSGDNYLLFSFTRVWIIYAHILSGSYVDYVIFVFATKFFDRHVPILFINNIRKIGHFDNSIVDIFVCISTMFIFRFVIVRVNYELLSSVLNSSVIESFTMARILTVLASSCNIINVIAVD